MDYKPGDIVGGYRLDWTGTEWEPVDGMQPARRPPRRRTGLILAAVLPPALLVALLHLGVALAAFGYGTGASAPVVAEGRAGAAVAGPTPAPTPMPTPAPSRTPTPRPVPVDSDGDGVPDDVDAFPTGASRSSLEDRDGDGTPNGADVAPDDASLAAWPTAVVTRVVDGDTVDVAGLGRIRVIGIDTPEHGQCGFEEAADLMTYLVLHKQVTLVPGARDDRDAYDRLLRYVVVDGGKDAGREMIGTGWAVARYDSRDGYGGHPREADYVALDAQVPDRTCPRPAPVAPAPALRPAPAAPAAEPWNVPGPDLDCADIGRRVRISGPDYHRLDRDNDGWGCESYG